MNVLPICGNLKPDRRNITTTLFNRSTFTEDMVRTVENMEQIFPPLAFASCNEHVYVTSFLWLSERL